MKSKSIYVRMLNLRREFGIFWGVAAGFIYMLLVFIGGIVGYMWIEGWNFLNSFYMVVITLSTVGFMEVLPLSENGRILTSLLILGGVGGFAYLIGAFSQLLVEGRLQAILGRRRMQKTIGKFKDHIIVCGYGRIGAIVTEEVMNEGLDIVVIESNPDLIIQMEAAGITCLEGDATKDDTLKLAGLDRAKSLIAALSDEAANVYVTLIARQFSSKVNIIARVIIKPVYRGSNLPEQTELYFRIQSAVSVWLSLCCVQLLQTFLILLCAGKSICKWKSFLSLKNLN